MISTFHALAGSASDTAFRRALAGLTLALAAAWGIRAWIGCPPIGYGLSDSVLALLNAERIVQGQLPVRDYSGAFWISSSLIGAAGILIAGCRGLAITVGYLIVAPVCAAAAWQMAKVRFSAFLAAALAFMVGVMTVAVNAPGGLRGTYAEHYNRFGWVLLTLVALQALVPPRERLSGRRAAWECFFSGVCTAALLFLKLNYFAAAALTFAIGSVLFRHVRQGLGGAILGFGLIFTAILAFLRFDLAGWLNDVVATSKAVGGGPLVTMLVHLLPACLPWVALTAIPLLAIIGPVARQAVAERRLTDNLRMTVAAMIMVPAGVLTCSMNHQVLGIPLLVLAAVALTEVSLRRESQAREEGGWACARSCVCLLAALASFAPTLGLDLLAMGLAWKQRVFDLPSAPVAARFNLPTLADFVCLPRAGEPLPAGEVLDEIRQGNHGRESLTGYQCAVILNDGIDLLTPHVGGRDRIVCMDGFNPFPLAFGLDYIPGEFSWFQVRVLTDESTCPLTEAVLAKATLAMELKRVWPSPTAEYIVSVRGAALREQFERVAESRFWILWRRRATTDEARHAGHSISFNPPATAGRAYRALLKFLKLAELDHPTVFLGGKIS